MKPVRRQPSREPPPPPDTFTTMLINYTEMQAAKKSEADAASKAAAKTATDVGKGGRKSKRLEKERPSLDGLPQTKKPAVAKGKSKSKSQKKSPLPLKKSSPRKRKATDRLSPK